MNTAPNISAPAPVESPCVNICKLIEGTVTCAGCYRLVSEITVWTRIDDEARRAICLAAAERKAKADAGMPLR